MLQLDERLEAVEKFGDRQLEMSFAAAATTTTTTTTTPAATATTATTAQPARLTCCKKNELGGVEEKATRSAKAHITQEGFRV